MAAPEIPWLAARGAAKVRREREAAGTEAGSADRSFAELTPARSGLSESASLLFNASYAEHTRATYDGAMRRFQRWCEQRDRKSLPAAPETVADYLGALWDDGVKGASLSTYLYGIASHHRDCGLPDPSASSLVQRVLRGAMRLRGRGVQRKAAAELDPLQKMLSEIPNDLVGKRDRALLSLGFAGAMRRSEIVALNVEDLEFTPSGMIVFLRRSKTDQLGVGEKIAIPTGSNLRAVDALSDWLHAASIQQGPVFRPIYHGHVIERRVNAVLAGRLLKKYAVRANLDPTVFSGHSLRIGFITEAANAGVDAVGIMLHSRHRTTRQLRAYVRKANLFKRHPGDSFL